MTTVLSQIPLFFIGPIKKYLNINGISAGMSTLINRNIFNIKGESNLDLFINIEKPNNIPRIYN